MSLDPDGRDVITALNRVADNAAHLAAKVENLEERGRHDRRVTHWLVATIAVLALLVAVAFGGFGLWNHHQDVRARQQEISREHARQARDAQIAALESRLSATQAQNTAFREGFCRMDKSIQVYLAYAPAGAAAGQAAARRMIAALGALCLKR